MGELTPPEGAAGVEGQWTEPRALQSRTRGSLTRVTVGFAVRLSGLEKVCNIITRQGRWCQGQRAASAFSCSLPWPGDGNILLVEEMKGPSLELEP